MQNIFYTKLVLTYDDQQVFLQVLGLILNMCFEGVYRWGFLALVFLIWISFLAADL